MKKLAFALTLLASLPLAAQVTKEDIKKLAAAGISDEVILSYVKSNGPVAKLSAEDVVELKQAGASEKVLSVVLSSSAATPAPAPEYRNESRVVERQVYSPPATTYVYDSSPYYYPYYSSSYYSGYYPRYYYPTYSSYCAPRYSYASYCSPSISLGLGFYGGRSCSPYTSYSIGGRIRR